MFLTWIGSTENKSCIKYIDPIDNTKQGVAIMAEQQDQARREYILSTIEAEDVRFVNLEFTDVVGMANV